MCCVTLLYLYFIWHVETIFISEDHSGNPIDMTSDGRDIRTDYLQGSICHECSPGSTPSSLLEILLRAGGVLLSGGEFYPSYPDVYGEIEKAVCCSCFFFIGGRRWKCLGQPKHINNALIFWHWFRCYPEGQCNFFICQAFYGGLVPLPLFLLKFCCSNKVN